MKKYYCITILALLVVTLLQGYNVSLQYKEYTYKEIDKINSALKVSVDEEYAIRAHQNYNPHKDGKQRLYTKNNDGRRLHQSKAQERRCHSF